ncbi:unnamed protein product, partial [Brassica rapa]
MDKKNSVCMLKVHGMWKKSTNRVSALESKQESKKVKFQPRKREIADDVPNIEDLGTANGALS